MGVFGGSFDGNFDGSSSRSSGECLEGKGVLTRVFERSFGGNF